MRRYRKPAAILRAAINLISDPDRWCRFNIAIDASGRRVEPQSSDACRWCAVGAIRVCAIDLRGALDVQDLFDRRGFLSRTNDRKGHKVVLRRMRRMLARLEAEERK